MCGVSLTLGDCGFYTPLVIYLMPEIQEWFHFASIAG